MSTSRVRYQDTGRHHTLADTESVTHLRIFREVSSLDGEEWPWNLDGVDDEGNFTDDLRQFRTHAEAIEAVPEFIQDVFGDDFEVKRK